MSTKKRDRGGKHTFSSFGTVMNINTECSRFYFTQDLNFPLLHQSDGANYLESRDGEGKRPSVDRQSRIEMCEGSLESNDHSDYRGFEQVCSRESKLSFVQFYLLVFLKSIWKLHFSGEGDICYLNPSIEAQAVKNHSRIRVDRTY